MTADSIHQELRTRWASMASKGSISEVLTELRTQLGNPLIRPGFVLCWQASMYNQLGEHKLALEAAKNALDSIIDGEDIRTVALIHANIGLALTGAGHAETSDDTLNEFAISERMLGAIGDEWALGGVLGDFALMVPGYTSIVKAGTSTVGRRLSRTG
jgi:hypothetical protein